MIEFYLVGMAILGAVVGWFLAKIYYEEVGSGWDKPDPDQTINLKPYKDYRDGS